MSNKNAGQFVEAMKSDRVFRGNVVATGNTDDLKKLLTDNGFGFSEHELVIAMAGCMAQMDNAAE